MAYLHGDGVYQKYGTEKATATKAGEYKTFGPNRTIEIKNLALTGLSTTAAIVGDVITFPIGYIVERVETWARVAATTGTSATLDIGVIGTDRSTGGDVDAILAQAAIADMNADGEYHEYGGPPAAGGLGVYGDKDTIPTAVKYITASTATGTYTAGVVDVRIHIRPYTT